MKYRYYVHDIENNIGVTEFSSDLHGAFIECLCDIIDFLVFDGDQKIMSDFTFKFLDIDGDNMLVIICNDLLIVRPNDIRDYIKGLF